MPREFRLLDLAPDVLLPQRFAKGDLPDGPWLFKGIARLKHGVTIDVANRDAARVLIQLEHVKPARQHTACL